jgi:prepilin signal peptidase PulO-like enzyme (type II secretory pathway)
MTYYLIGGGLGTLSGLALYFLALHHLKVRSEFDDKNIYNKIKSAKYALIWMFITALMFLIITYCEKDNIDGSLYIFWEILRIGIYAMIAIDVSAIDILMRKIPNTALLAMLLVELINISLLILLFSRDSVETIFRALFGAVIAYAIFTFPAMFKLNVGAGDIKYSVVLGFILGFGNYFEAMAVMAFANIMLYIYLKLFKRGNLKTAAPMGPFLSTGAMVALLAPIFG